MSIYRYPAASAVSEVRFRYAAQRAPVALLAAQAGGDPAKLAEIRQVIGQQGWQAVPMAENGRQVLQVTGFNDPGEVAALLSAYGFAPATPLVVPEPGDAIHKDLNQWAEHHSLKTAGWLNLIGDAGLLIHGLQTGQPYEILGGALYTGGAGVLSRYANVTTEHQVRQVLAQTADTIQQQAGQLPEDAGLTRIAEEHRKGGFQRIENFLYRYPAEVMLSAYTLGALAMLRSGIKKGDPWGIAYGVSSVGFKVASLMIPEKHKSETAGGPVTAPADTGPLGAMVNWIQEKPLRLMGFGSLVTDTLLGMSAYREFKGRASQKGAIFKFITTGTYLAADLLMAVSNKHTENADGKFSPDEQARIEAMAAETIAQQPKEIQGALVLKVSRLLGARPEMHGGVEGVSRNIDAQIAQIGQNPWASRVKVEGDALSPSLR